MEIRREMDRLLAQFGRGNRYHRVGFSFMYLGGKPEMLQRAARLAAENGLVLGPIIGLQTHGNGLYWHFVSDLRNYQWNAPPYLEANATVPGVRYIDMRFTAAYSACAVCSPTRAAIMTGKYPARISGRTTDHTRGAN